MTASNLENTASDFEIAGGSIVFVMKEEFYLDVAAKKQVNSEI